MDNEPELHIVSFRGKKTHIIGDSINSSVCGVNVGDASKVDLQRLDVDYLAGDNGTCKRCKAISTRIYLDWVNSLTEDDLEFRERE